MTDGSPIHFTTRLQQYSDSIFRVSISLASTPGETALNRYGFIEQCPPDARQVKTTVGEMLQVGSTRANIKVLSTPGAVSVVLQKDGTELLSGEMRFDASRHRWQAVFELKEIEQLFGLGDQTRDAIEHRGTHADMWIKNVESYIPIPFLMSSRGYGVFCNTTRRHQWDLGKTESQQWRIDLPNDDIDLYLLVGDSLKEVLGRYTDLTGKPALPPKWSFGLWYLCHEKVDVFETMRTASAFREREIPCDVIALEPGWMETYYDFSTEKRWHPERFPVVSHLNAYNFTDALRNMGFHLGLWLCNDYDLSYEAERQAQQCEVEKQSDEYGFAQGDVVQDRHFQTPVRLDTITKPDEPWFEHLKKFIDQGASFFKQDGANQTLEHPDRFYGNGMHDDAMHNLYPLLYSRQMYDGFKEYTGLRSCCFTPNGWAGLQRYTGTWTGDTGGGKATLAACLNLVMSGHGLVTCDMKVTGKAGIHYGFLLPWAQVNSFACFQQPWYLGEELYAVFRDYAQLRSRLIPYLYTAAYNAHQSGVPMMRPLALEFPDEPQVAGVLRQYLLGEALMVTAFTDEVYLPAGKWLDFWSGEVLTGSQTVRYEAPSNRGGGLFLRSNSILPLGPLKQYVHQNTGSGYQLHIFLDSESSASATVFDDDGVSFRYQDGEFVLHEWRAEYSGSRLRIQTPQTAATDGIIAYLDTKPDEVLVNGELVSFDWDEPRGIVRVELRSV